MEATEVQKNKRYVPIILRLTKRAKVDASTGTSSIGVLVVKSNNQETTMDDLPLATDRTVTEVTTKVDHIIGAA